MADVPDWLLDVGGAALGLNKGAVLAADPYKAWAEVNTRDLANERFGVQNRDIAAIQAAKENPDLNYYGNYVGAANVASQLAAAKGTSDIYNTNTALDLQKVLGPGGPFQAEAKARGLTPNMPEYRRLAEEYIGRFNPQAGIAAEDLFKIPEVQNRNTMDQLNEAYVQAYARMSDRNAIAVRQVDGTFKIYGSHGEQIPVNADQLAAIVSFMKSGDPAQVIRQGLTNQAEIQKANATMVTALGNYRRYANTNLMNQTQIGKALSDLRIGYDRQVGEINKKIAAIEKSDEYKFAKTQEEKDAMLAPHRADLARASTLRAQGMQVLHERATALGIPFASQIPPGATSGGVPIAGQSALTTGFNRPVPGSIGGGLATGRPSTAASVGNALETVGNSFTSRGTGGQGLEQFWPNVSNPGIGFGVPPGAQGLDFRGAPAANPYMNFGVPQSSADPTADLFGLGNEPTASANPGLEQYIQSLLQGTA